MRASQVGRCVVVCGCLLIACIAGAAGGEAAPGEAVQAVVERPDLERLFGEIDGAFVLLDGQTGEMVVVNAQRAGERFLPASTFKIPNTLIALETGVASGPEFALSRDAALAPQEDWWPASWLEDHTLRTALPNSVVWFYQEIARRIGHARMQAYVDQFNYGNRDISGGIDQFWLTGGLRISSIEQVKFLQRFYRGELGVRDGVTQTTKELLVMEETPTYRLSWKTGWADVGKPDVPQVGWLVGYVERGEDVWFYATNIEIRERDDAAARLPVTKAMLTELGLLRED